MNNSYRFTALAGAIALAMGTVGANAATTTATPALPTIAATQLPGHGAVVSGSATAGTISHGAEIITVTGNTVIDWGKTGGTLNAAAGSATGFNVGSAAKLTFAQGTNGVLNIDSTGNPSQILGAVTGSGAGNIYVANENGVIVGAGGSITNGGDIGLIGTKAAATGFDGTLSTITYNGVGGTVTVAKGASLSGHNILIAGGSSVNVDLGALHAGGSVALTAGLKSANASALATNATDSNLSVTGSLAGGTGIVAFESVGDAMVGQGAKVDLTTAGGNVKVAGTLTNLGTLTLPNLPSASGAAPVGALVNSGTVTAGSELAVGTLTNNAKLSGSGAATLSTTSGGLTNAGQINGFKDINVTGGDFLNQGQVTGSGSGRIDVTNGNLTNSGKIGGFVTLRTTSNASAPGFTKGADYSLTNNGTITASTNHLYLSANWEGSGSASGTDSTGSINNKGTLQLPASGELQLSANNDVTLGGAVQVLNGTKYVATSSAHPLGSLGMYAARSGSAGFGAKTGTATLATDIVARNGGSFDGLQVAFKGNFSVASASGAPNGWVDIYAGPAAGDPTDAANSDYAVRVAAGKTVSADSISIYGSSAAATPNVILQGTFVGDDITLGGTGGGVWGGPVSDVFTGANGGIVLSGAAPTLTINSTGRVKAAPYLNDANFRFNGLPVSVVGSGSTVNLTLNPMPTGNVADMQGTPAAGFNLTVNGNVNLVDTLTAAAAGAPTASGDTAVEGLGQVPNTHLVLQSTGNITTGAAFAGSALTGGDFYWPGYVYLGNINAASGVAAPGTAGLGTITTTGAFNNALAGNVDGADGIHFMTQFPLTLGGDVITNANAWVNFPTQQLVDGYAGGVLSPSTHFIGGSNTAGKVITYGPLGSGDFHLQPLNSTR